MNNTEFDETICPKGCDCINCVEEAEEAAKEKRRESPYYTVELAKSGRSRCKGCKESISQGEPRIGVNILVNRGDGMKFRSTLWHHVSCVKARIHSTSEVKGFDTLAPDAASRVESQLVLRQIQPALEYSGELDLTQFSSILTGKYRRFRGFNFGLLDSEKYSENWNWRCFIATMLVCNTKEDQMLAYLPTLFSKYPTMEKLAAVEDEEAISRIKLEMDKGKLRHTGRKARDIIRNSKHILKVHKGRIPRTRTELMKMRGVGRHVSSVVMAWVHQKGEFGIDVHVDRIMKRWGFAQEGQREVDIESKVKQEIPTAKIGHFSRSLVDLGQEVCGFSPDCSSCVLRRNCPTGRLKASDLEW